MILTITVSSKRYVGTAADEGDMLISVQRTRDKLQYPEKVAWTRRIEGIKHYPANEKELLEHAIRRMAAWLARPDDGWKHYDDEGQRVAEMVMG